MTPRPYCALCENTHWVPRDEWDRICPKCRRRIWPPDGTPKKQEGAVDRRQPQGEASNARSKLQCQP